MGRKRKPDSEADLEVEEVVEVAVEAEERRGGKRARLLDRLARPFRTTVPLVARRNAEVSCITVLCSVVLVLRDDCSTILRFRIFFAKPDSEVVKKVRKKSPHNP